MKYILYTFLSLILLPLLCRAEPAVNCPDADYEEQNGLVVIELENTSFTGSSWAYENVEGGFTGTGYILWRGNQYFNNASNGVITIPVRINNPGTYDIQFRARISSESNENNTEHNDVWIKVADGARMFADKNGSEVEPRPQCENNSNVECPEGSSTNGFFKAYGGNKNNFTWYSNTYDNNAHRIKVTFNSPGTYNVQVAARSSLYMLDRLVLSNPSLISQNDARSTNQEETLCEASDSPPPSGAADISGELKKWHKVSLTFDGPNSSETANTNPFTDYRLLVTFSRGNKRYTVHGFYAGDGNAAETSSNTGNKWRVHFAPDEVGVWNYSVSFRQGTDIAIDLAANTGSSAGFMDGETGTFTIGETDKSGRDHRGKGRLQYVGEHYLRYGETGEYFVKMGADAPENTLAYEDFDEVPNRGNRRKNWNPHAGDYLASDASTYTWQNGKGSELLGAIKYLSDKGMNVFSFLTLSLHGDDENVFPYLLRVPVSTYNGYNDGQQWNNGVHHDRFDVSRLDQWEKIFEYADKKGMFMHFKTLETENDNIMDNNTFGRERRIYYRELVARFGHHLGLNWNISEEITLSSGVIENTAEWIKAIDPYDHIIVFHTYPGDKDRYDSHLGPNSDVDGASLQTSNGNFTEVRSDVLEWVGKSANAGKKWVVALDEPGTAGIGVHSDPNEIDLVRERVIWNTLMAGGAGVEFYYGYQSGCGDLECQDHRTRDTKYGQAAYALQFFNENLPFHEMVANDGLTSDGGDYVFAKTGEIYAVYRPDGGSTDINLPTGDWSVRWYNPRNGTFNGNAVSLGNTLSAPDNNDWVALISNGEAPPPDDCFPSLDQVSLTPTDDAYLQGGQLFNNSSLRVEAGNRVSYLKFTLPNLAFASAELQLQVDTDGGNGTVSLYKGSSTNWTETTLSTANAPQQTTLLASQNGTFNVGGIIRFDIPVGQLSPGEVSLILVQSAGGNDFDIKSSENVQISGRPQLLLSPSTDARIPYIPYVLRNGDSLDIGNNVLLCEGDTIQMGAVPEPVPLGFTLEFINPDSTLIYNVTNGDQTIVVDPLSAFIGTWTFRISTTQGCVFDTTFTVSESLACDSDSTRILNLIAMLQGPFANGEMTTILGALIPLTDPYLGETTIPNLPPDVVDWVLVQFRSPSDYTLILQQQAFPIQKDGSVLSPDGSIGIRIPESLPESAYVAILHKSHLGVITASPVVLMGLLDLSDPATPVMGSNARAIFGNQALLYVGDYDGNAIINNLDFNQWKLNAAAINQYLNTDGDANGVNNNLDYNLWRRNGSQIGTLELTLP